MAQYRAHFLTHSGEIFGVAHFEAEHDEAAIAHAHDVLATNIGKGHEVWRGSRLVHAENYD